MAEFRGERSVGQWIKEDEEFSQRTQSMDIDISGEGQGRAGRAGWRWAKGWTWETSIIVSKYLKKIKGVAKE